MRLLSTLHVTARMAAWSLVILSMTVFWAEPAQPAGLNAGPWPMFHRNAAHEGRSSVPIAQNPVLIWSTSLSDAVEFSSPAVDHSGTIYLGNLDNELWAVNAIGDSVWTYNTGGNLRRSSPAVADDGTIYFGSNDGSLYAIHPNGSLKWAVPTGSAVKTSPAVASNGTVYFGTDGAELWAVLPDGSVDWTFPVGDTIRSSPAVVGDTLIVFGCNDGFIYAVNSDGSSEWAAATGGPVKASPAVGQGGAIIVGSFDGFLYNIWPTGSLNWATLVGDEMRSSPAIGSTGKIYLGVDNEIHCYRDEGNLSWTYPTGDRVCSSPAVAPDPTDTEVVICGSDDGKIYVVRTPGVEVWSFSIGSPVRSSPAIGANGLIHVGALDGRLYTFGESSSSVDDEITDIGPRLNVGPNPLPAGTRLTVRIHGATPDQGSAGVFKIYDPSGRRVRSLPLDPNRPTYWDGRNERGDLLPSGVYLYQWVGDGVLAKGRIARVR